MLDIDYLGLGQASDSNDNELSYEYDGDDNDDVDAFPSRVSSMGINGTLDKTVATRAGVSWGFNAPDATNGGLIQAVDAAVPGRGKRNSLPTMKLW